MVTGIYTLLFPLIAFAAFGSSRYLVVAADSATAAIIAGGVSPMAAIMSPRYVALTGLVALLTAGFLFVARVPEPDEDRRGPAGEPAASEKKLVTRRLLLRCLAPSDPGFRNPTTPV